MGVTFAVVKISHTVTCITVAGHTVTCITVAGRHLVHKAAGSEKTSERNVTCITDRSSAALYLRLL